MKKKMNNVHLMINLKIILIKKGHSNVKKSPVCHAFTDFDKSALKLYSENCKHDLASNNNSVCYANIQYTDENHER